MSIVLFIFIKRNLEKTAGLKLSIKIPTLMLCQHNNYLKARQEFFIYNLNMKNSKLQDRANIVTYIYQSELLKNSLNSDHAFESGVFDNAQLKKIEAIAKNYNKFQKIVSKYLKSTWSWERIDPLERAILIYGAFEMSFLDKALVINEMVILAKGYIPGDNYKYINSILDKVGDYYEKIKNG